LRAQRSNPALRCRLDCFVAPLLAMTAFAISARMFIYFSALVIVT
jgi:hypothetical protein